jgi:hypothetical protein
MRISVKSGLGWRVGVVLLALTGVLLGVRVYFHRAREEARRTSCLSNLKSLGLAFAMYLEDWDDTLPPAEEANDPYYWVAPLLLSEPKRGPAVRYFGMGWVALVCPARFALQSEVQKVCPGASDDQVRQLLVDHPERYLRYIGDPALAGKRVTDRSQTMAVFDDEPRHLGGRCAVFLDGHAQWLCEDEWQQARVLSNGIARGN